MPPRAPVRSDAMGSAGGDPDDHVLVDTDDEAHQAVGREVLEPAAQDG